MISISREHYEELLEKAAQHDKIVKYIDTRPFKVDWRDADAILCIHNVTKYTSINPVTGKHDMHYRDQRDAHQYRYEGQKKSKEFDGYFAELGNETLMKPIIIFEKSDNNVVRVFVSIRVTSYTPRVSQGLDKTPPALHIQVREYDIEQHRTRRNKKEGIPMTRLMTILGIEDMLNKRKKSGIRPVQIHNEDFKKMLIRPILHYTKLHAWTTN